MKFEKLGASVFGDGKDIIFIDGKYYMVSVNPNNISYSEDLKNWNSFRIGESDDFDSLAYGNSIFVVCGSTDYGIYTSTNGENWNNRPFSIYSKWGQKNIKASLNTVRFINNRFVIVSGTTWTTTHSDGTKEYHDEGHILISNNGISWADKFESDEVSFMEIAYGNNIYVAVGTKGGIYTSKDLNTWSKRVSNTKLKLVGISFGKGLFVITGDDGIILTSMDGINWIKRESTTNSYLIRSRYGNGLYVAVGYNATILTSVDGISWHEQDEGYNRGVWYGMVYTNNRYVITGNHLTDTNQVALVYFDITRDLDSYDNDCLFVYDNNLNRLGIIDEFKSLKWKRKYFEAGEFTLVVTPDKNNIPLLTKKDNIIIRDNYTEAAIIEIIDIVEYEQETELTVSGRFLSSVFDRRIIKQKINFNGQTIEAMKYLINNATAICNNFEIEPTQLISPNIQFQCTYKNLYTYLVKLSKFGLIGFRLVPNVENKTFIFENYQGYNRTHLQDDNERYAFSDDQHNIQKSSFILSSKTEYNFALVGGSGEDTNRILKSVSKGIYTGFDLREVFVDAKNQSNNNISPVDYLNQLEELGKEAMTDETFTFETSVDSTDYKTKWDLGDIVDLKYEEWNVISQKIISEIEEDIADGKRDVIVTLGTPLPEAIGSEE